MIKIIHVFFYFFIFNVLQMKYKILFSKMKQNEKNYYVFLYNNQKINKIDLF